MEWQIVQHVQQKLINRFRRLQCARFAEFHSAAVQLLDFIANDPFCSAAIETLRVRFPQLDVQAAAVFEDPDDEDEQVLPYFAESADGQAALSYFVLRRCTDWSTLERGVAGICVRVVLRNDFEVMLERFSNIFVERLFAYLLEQLTAQRAVLALLMRYKQKCERFARYRLRQEWSDRTSTGERRLADHLYEWLQDQGADFHVEPLIASGRPDLVAGQTGSDPVVLDLKIFKDDAGYIRSGVRQVLEYTLELNEPIGYLVIFQTGRRPLRIAGAHTEMGVPSARAAGKTIFVLVIDLIAHQRPASKRRSPAPAVLDLSAALDGI